MTTREQIEVMQAFLEGKEIEQAPQLDLSNWWTVAFPVWDWSHFEYRIKPEPPKPKYRPFETIEEILDAKRKHGELITSKDRSVYITIARIDNRHSGLMVNGRHVNDMLIDRMFEDGAPFGVEEGGAE